MKKLIGFLAVTSALALIILGLISFKLFPFNTPATYSPSSSPESKVRVKSFLSQDEDYAENIKKGDSYAKKGYGTLAIQSYTLANKIYPGKSEPYKKIGLVYFNNQNYEKAAENFQRGIEINNQDYEAIVFLSKSQFKQDKKAEAEETLKKFSSQNNDVKLQLSYLMISQQKLEDAKNLISEVVTDSTGSEIQKKTADHFLKSFEGYEFSRGAPAIYLETLLAKNLTQTENYEFAIPLLQKVLEDKNTYRDAWILLGYSYLNSQRPLDAAEALKEALKLAPEKAETRYLLALALFYNKNLEEAIENMEIAIQNDFKPKNEALSQLGEMYLTVENYEAAVRTYEELLKINNDDVNLFIKPVWIYLEHLNNYGEADKLAHLAQNTFPTSAMSYNLLGWVKTKQGEFTEAKQNFEKALEIDPDLDAVYLNLGIWNEKQNQFEEAKKNYKTAYEKGDGNSVANLAAIQYNKLIRNTIN